MRHNSLATVFAFSVFSLCLSFESAKAQIVISGGESASPVIDSHVAPIWEGFTTGNETNWQPYVPYPGQLGHPTTNTLPTWSQESQPMSFQSTQIGSVQEIIISEEPVDGVIIGTFQNGQLIYKPGYSESTNAPIAELNLDSMPTPLGEIVLDAATVDSENTAPATDPGQIEIVDIDSTDKPVGEMEAESNALERAKQIENELQEKIKSLRAEITTLESSLEEAGKQSQTFRRKLKLSERAMNTVKENSSAEMTKMAQALEQSKANTAQLRQALELKEQLVRGMKKDKASKAEAIDQKQEKEIAKLRKENKQIRSRMAQASKLVDQMEKQLAQLKDEHVSQIKEQKANARKHAQSHSETLQDLADTKAKLAEKTKSHAMLKEQFIKAFETDKKNQEKVESAKKSSSNNEKAEKKKKDSKNKKSSSKDDSDNKKHMSESDKKLSAKEKRTKAKEAELREEMKKKMTDARERITAVGQKKIDALIQKGKKKGGEEIKEIKEQVSKSLRVSDRKIRARYERKILKLK